MNSRSIITVNATIRASAICSFSRRTISPAAPDRFAAQAVSAECSITMSGQRDQMPAHFSFRILRGPGAGSRPDSERTLTEIKPLRFSFRSSEFADLNPRERSWCCRINRSHNLCHVRFDHWPADGRKRDDGDLPAHHILLVRQRKIPGDHDIEILFFRSGEQLTVFQASPAKIGGGEGFVVTKMRPQIMRYIFVQQDFQGCN